MFNCREFKIKNNLVNSNNITLTVDTIYQYESLVELLKNLNLVNKEIFYKDLKEKYIKDYPHKHKFFKTRYKEYPDYLL